MIFELSSILTANFATDCIKQNKELINKKLVIHNAEFDIAHLNHELKLLGKDELKNEVTDTLTLARDKFPGSPISLDALCKRYRIDNSKRVQHTALIDCDLLAKVYINLIDQKEPTLDFQKVDAKPEFSKKENILYFKKVIKPTEDKLKKHINKMKNFFISWPFLLEFPLTTFFLDHKTLLCPLS